MKGKRILVVDDKFSMRELLATALGERGFVVEVAESGEAAQPTLFGMFDPEKPEPPAEDPAIADVLAEIRGTDPNALTPLEALNRLAAWRRQLRGDEKE